jgi:HAD superfamily hydrolase (TIGR01509 family)
MELPRALLLDLDDTILDDSSGADLCWRAVCEEFACPAGVPEGSILHAAVAAERDWYWADRERHRIGRLDLGAAREAIVAGGLRRLGREPGALAGAIAEAYAAARRASTRPFPGAVAALEAFRSRGVRMALVTNGASAAQREKIDRFGLAGFFDGIFVEGEMGFGKPDDRVFHRALEAVGAAPGDAWVVGDNLEWEIAPARRLGMGSVWVDARGAGLPPDAPARPDRVVGGIRELVGHSVGGVAERNGG